MKHEVDQVVGAELGDGLEQYVDLGGGGARAAIHGTCSGQ
jgi:hypothetical protein